MSASSWSAAGWWSEKMGADYKILIGHEVRQRLARTPGAFKIPSNDLDIFVVRDFLSHAECAKLCALIDGQRIPSQLLAPTEDPDFRTSESCNLDPHDPFVRTIEADRKSTRLNSSHTDI